MAGWDEFFPARWIGIVTAGRGMKRISASALQSACEMPVDKRRASTSAAPNQAPARRLDARKPRFEADLAHVARLAALGEMLAGIAHEISQPLFAIQNFARASNVSLTRSEPVDRDTLHAWTRQITLEADRVCAIIYRLRDFGRAAPPRAARHDDVPQLVQEAVDLVLPQARLRKIVIELDLDNAARTIYADRIQIQQVLVNLLKNACEAIAISGAPSGHVTVCNQPENGCVRFSVSDTGGGLPPVDPSKLFEPFFTTKPDGVGIGLALSRSIVEAAHGRLWAEPDARRGAVFHFTVPSGPEATNEQ